MPRLILKKTSRRTQAVVIFRRHFLCGALLCNFFIYRAWRSIYTCPTGMFSRTFYAQYSVTKNLHISPRFSLTIVYQDANSVLLLAHFCTAVFDIRLYPQNPVFKIVHDENVKIAKHSKQKHTQHVWRWLRCSDSQSCRRCDSCTEPESGGWFWWWKGWASCVLICHQQKRTFGGRRTSSRDFVCFRVSYDILRSSWKLSSPCVPTTVVVLKQPIQSIQT